MNIHTFFLTLLLFSAFMQQLLPAGSVLQLSQHSADEHTLTAADRALVDRIKEGCYEFIDDEWWSFLRLSELRATAEREAWRFCDKPGGEESVDWAALLHFTSALAKAAQRLAEHHQAAAGHSCIFDLDQCLFHSEKAVDHATGISYDLLCQCNPVRRLHLLARELGYRPTFLTARPTHYFVNQKPSWGYTTLFTRSQLTALGLGEDDGELVCQPIPMEKLLDFQCLPLEEQRALSATWKAKHRAELARSRPILCTADDQEENLRPHEEAASTLGIAILVPHAALVALYNADERYAGLFSIFPYERPTKEQAAMHSARVAASLSDEVVEE